MKSTHASGDGFSYLHFLEPEKLERVRMIRDGELDVDAELAKTPIDAEAGKRSSESQKAARLARINNEAPSEVGADSSTAPASPEPDINPGGLHS